MVKRATGGTVGVLLLQKYVPNPDVGYAFFHPDGGCDPGRARATFGEQFARVDVHLCIGGIVRSTNPSNPGQSDREKQGGQQGGQGGQGGRQGGGGGGGGGQQGGRTPGRQDQDQDYGQGGRQGGGQNR